MPYENRLGRHPERRIVSSTAASCESSSARFRSCSPIASCTLLTRRFACPEAVAAVAAVASLQFTRRVGVLRHRVAVDEAGVSNLTAFAQVAAYSVRRVALLRLVTGPEP